MNKLENIENGIIELLIKKYHVDEYSEIHNYKNTIINTDILKKGIINDSPIANKVINKYLEIHSELCTYDIDIVNLIIKYISLNKNVKIEPNYTILESIYYYLGYNKNEIEDRDYFDTKALSINNKIRQLYLFIFKDIISPLSK
jgi:hypothetical protein